MKKSVLLKLLINVLILFSIIGLLGLAINIPLKKCIMSPIKICIADWNLFYWFIAIIGLTACSFFLKSLYHLRRTAILLDNESFSDIINHLKKSGTCFFVTGIIYSFVIILLWAYLAIETGVVEIGYDMDLIPPLFLIIIGIIFRKISSLSFKSQ
ncbi:hypothetical protein EYD45_13895 [Hyunsoonleella flava]|uniref:DUF2975 domain-containing protein n=1 Tax=Hyunsoonleella flava TaxID=2527939 RepID=A0A4Q9FCA2_9FLAO|nr:hypothetical protein [Hyunsoonleella flava]TBN00912.1 hypothetical protein EYD45_13895 [Hyunsoonleella flava]